MSLTNSQGVNSMTLTKRLVNSSNQKREPVKFKVQARPQEPTTKKA